MYLLRWIFYVVTTFLLISSGNSTFIIKSPTILDHIKHDGVLRVVTRLDQTTYYEGAEGITGLEYDLVTLFAQQLGVEVNFIIPDSFDEILNLMATNLPHIAAAGLTVTEKRAQSMRFSPPYYQITEQIIYRSGTRRPKKVNDLTKGILEIVKGTSHIDSLHKLKKKWPDLEWLENDAMDTDGLLYLVNQGLIDYTVADSNQITLIGRFFPKLNVAFDISEPQQIAWALPLTSDISLYREVEKFFKNIQSDNTLSQLIERHYGHATSLNYVGLCKFREHMQSRLPEYKSMFITEAAKYNIDWRLLAAIGYQESHWMEKATSPTGVRGIMMLTEGTAKQLGVKDRTDPKQSIAGGSRYFLQRIKKIPRRIMEPDRTWMALASYNVGFGHLEDARILTQNRSGNPDKWMDVKKNLPLLSQEKWYKKTKHGFARGKEPVQYVENIRSYYDLLVWLTDENNTEKHAGNGKTPNNRALEINPPVL